MKRKSIILSLMAAVAAFSAFTTAASAQDKFPFRLNWTLYGEHAPFFVALDKGFYKEEGLDVEILEGSGSTTVAQLVANTDQPGRLCRRRDHDAWHQCRHADRGGRRDAAAEPDVLYLPRRQCAADQGLRNQGQPHCHHRRRRQPRHLHGVHGQAEYADERRQPDHGRHAGGQGTGGARQAGGLLLGTSWIKARACSSSPA